MGPRRRPLRIENQHTACDGQTPRDLFSPRVASVLAHYPRTSANRREISPDDGALGTSRGDLKIRRLVSGPAGPFPDVPEHVEEPAIVRSKGPHWGRVDPPVVASPAETVHKRPVEGGAPEERRVDRAATRGVFPFRNPAVGKPAIGTPGCRIGGQSPLADPSSAGTLDAATPGRLAWQLDARAFGRSPEDGAAVASVRMMIVIPASARPGGAAFRWRGTPDPSAHIPCRTGQGRIGCQPAGADARRLSRADGPGDWAWLRGAGPRQPAKNAAPMPCALFEVPPLRAHAVQILFRSRRATLRSERRAGRFEPGPPACRSAQPIGRSRSRATSLASRGYRRERDGGDLPSVGLAHERKVIHAG